MGSTVGCKLESTAKNSHVNLNRVDVLNQSRKVVADKCEDWFESVVNSSIIMENLEATGT